MDADSIWDMDLNARHVPGEKWVDFLRRRSRAQKGKAFSEQSDENINMWSK